MYGQVLLFEGASSSAGAITSAAGKSVAVVGVTARSGGRGTERRAVTGGDTAGAGQAAAAGGQEIRAAAGEVMAGFSAVVT